MIAAPLFFHTLCLLQVWNNRAAARLKLGEAAEALADAQVPLRPARPSILHLFALTGRGTLRLSGACCFRVLSLGCLPSWHEGGQAPGARVAQGSVPRGRGVLGAGELRRRRRLILGGARHGTRQPGWYSSYGLPASFAALGSAFLSTPVCSRGEQPRRLLFFCNAVRR